MNANRLWIILLCICIAMSLLPTVVLAAGGTEDRDNGTEEVPTIQSKTSEQFKLALGRTYWFDLSGAVIPGTPNKGTSQGAVSVPDETHLWMQPAPPPPLKCPVET